MQRSRTEKIPALVAQHCEWAWQFAPLVYIGCRRSSQLFHLSLWRTEPPEVLVNICRQLLAVYTLQVHNRICPEMHTEMERVALAHDDGSPQRALFLLRNSPHTRHLARVKRWEDPDGKDKDILRTGLAISFPAFTNNELANCLSSSNDCDEVCNLAEILQCTKTFSEDY